jgi:N-acetylglucosaminyldiphosphoundecaprenol N-acetyl-beta-D-mannosaminyltransferase
LKTDSVNILSVNIFLGNLDETIARFEEAIDCEKKLRACVTPVNCVLWAYKNKKLRQIYNSSDMNLSDGVPLLWASRLLGKPIRGRVTGLDLLPAFAKTAARKNYSFFLMGAKEGVAEQLALSLQKEYQGLRIVGTYSPPFAETFSEEENRKIIALINEAKPDVLWISLTAPKQDYWIADHLKDLNVHVALGVGGAFEVTAGIIKRAPVWMQKNGLEWLFRFLQEPRRLFKRYFVEAPVFIPLLLLQRFGLLNNKIKDDEL